MIFVKSFTQATFQQIWKFTRRMRKPRHFLPPKTLFLAFESQKCDIHSLSSWNMYFLHLTIPTLSKTSKNIWNYTRNFFTMRNFTQSWNKFTQALLVMLVTNIKSDCIALHLRQMHCTVCNVFASNCALQCNAVMICLANLASLAQHLAFFQKFKCL